MTLELHILVLESRQFLFTIRSLISANLLKKTIFYCITYCREIAVPPATICHLPPQVVQLFVQMCGTMQLVNPYFKVLVTVPTFKNSAARPVMKNRLQLLC